MKIVKYGLLTTLVLLCVSGCGVRKLAAEYAGAKKYTAEVSDSITVSCGDEEYVVLDQTAEDNELGKWIGRVDVFEDNVFISAVNKGTDGKVFVMVNGKYYRAKPEEDLEEEDVLLDPADTYESVS